MNPKATSLMGGWNVADIQPCNLPQRVASAFTAVTENLVGAMYEPLLYIGSQIVNGINYGVIAKQSIPSPGGAYEHVVVMTLNQKPGEASEGEKYSLVDITTII